MVRALVELDAETNRILNIIKAKHGLRDKGQAIAFIAKKHDISIIEKTSAQKQLLFINDGDRWMLGEDIPDLDFFFSQVFLSCFVNEFAEPGGCAYRKILAVFNGYNMKFYFGEKDSFEVGKHLVGKFLSEPEFPVKVNSEIVRFADMLRSFTEKIPEKDMAALTNRELWDFYEGHDRIHTEYYRWCWIPVAIDMFHNNLTEKLKEYLKSINVDDERLNECFVVLTQPTGKSLIQVERDEFLKLAAAVKKDSRHRKLFKELYRNFEEQDVARFGYKTHTKEYEELLEQKVGGVIAQISPKVFGMIKAHYDKYFYINHMWVGKVHTFEHYLKEIVKLIYTNADIETTLEANEKEFRAGIRKRSQLIKKLGIRGKWLALFDAFGDFMITKIYRRFAQIYAIYKMEFVLQEIAKRLSISLMQARFMFPDEVKDALLNGVISRKELEEREKLCAYYAEKGRDVIYTGEKAEELARQAETTETKEVSELHGQIGCVGKAKGRVKLIFRPKDMAKMQKGDILVSIATDPDIVPAMRKAGAIVTEQGGVTSHAAIVSRELGTPCIIGTKIATKVLKDGDLVEVDANKGVVKILEKAK